jgi:hypothetical protein
MLLRLLGDSASKREDISTLAMKQIIEIARKMSLENRKLEEIEEYSEKGYFVDFSVHDASIVTPDIVQKTLVKDRIRKANVASKADTPFLSLSLSEVPRKITRILLEEAFRSILPLGDRISQLSCQ